MRRLESNNAMPSGDSAQAAAACSTLAAHSSVWLLVAVPAVMLGRVYYSCHWIGDTVAGAGLGLVMGALVRLASAGVCDAPGAVLGSLRQPGGAFSVCHSTASAAQLLLHAGGWR